MTFDLKKLGFVLVMVLGSSAVSAGSAPAYPFTAPGAGASQKTFLTGETTVPHVLTTPNGTV